MAEEWWDRAAQPYKDLWVPRLIPYQDDLVRKSTPRPGERVLVTSVGPASELLSIARAMEGRGTLYASDPSEVMLEHAREAISAAGVEMPIELVVAEPHDVLGQSWDLIVNSFGLWQLEDRIETLSAWRDALSYDGRVGVLVWGPPDPTGPFELMGDALHEIDPQVEHITRVRDLAAREPIAELLQEARLRLVRHAVVRHTMEFGSARGFFTAACRSCSFLRACEQIDRDRLAKLEQAFYDRLEPVKPDDPLRFAPAASVAIAEPG